MAPYSGHSRFDPLNRGGLIWIAADSFSDGDELLLAFPDCHCESLKIIKATAHELTLDDHGRSFKLRPWAESDGSLEDPKDPYGLGEEWTGPSSKWTIK